MIFVWQRKLECVSGVCAIDLVLNHQETYTPQTASCGVQWAGWFIKVFSVSGFALTSNSSILPDEISIYWKQNQQLVRHTSCYFVWLVLKNKKMQYVGFWETVCVCACVHACVCVCMCVRGGEGSWVFASTAVLVVACTAMHLTSYSDDCFPWTTFTTLQMSHLLKKILAQSLAWAVESFQLPVTQACLSVGTSQFGNTLHAHTHKNLDVCTVKTLNCFKNFFFSPVFFRRVHL